MHTMVENIPFWQACLTMCLAFCPYLLLGSLMAGILHWILPAGWIHKHLRGPSGVLKAVILGIPLPLCSCGVIPTGLGLRKQGADLGSSVGFLVSTPQTGIDSIIVSAGMLGWPFAWVKVLAALVSGLFGGWWTHFWIKETVTLKDDSVDFHQHHSHSAWRVIITHALSILEPIWGWIFFGIILSASIQSFLPAHLLIDLQQEHSFWVLPIVLLFSLPLYVCATASVPIAAALVSKGLSLGAALVFLMAGPASNAATIGAIYKALGGRVLFIYLSTLVIGSFSFAILATPWLEGQFPLEIKAHDMEHSYLEILSVIICMSLFTYFAYQQVQSWLIKYKGKKTQKTDFASMTYMIEGMSCGGCVRKLEKTLSTIKGIESFTVTRDPDQVELLGNFDQNVFFEAVQSIGFIASLYKI
jgi:uncharacterized protein